MATTALKEAVGGRQFGQGIRSARRRDVILLPGSPPAGHYIRQLAGYAHYKTRSKTILADTAIGGPAVSFTTANHKNLLAWTGTDAAHHLNIANFA